jgi:hypothetical protein
MSFRGRSVVTALLLGSGMGAFLALMFRIAVRNTPVVVNPQTFFWWVILLSAAGAVAGMALESVRQLQAGSSDPELRRGAPGRLRPVTPRRSRSGPSDSSGSPRERR